MANSLNKVLLTGTVTRDFEKKSDKLGVVGIVQDIWNGQEPKPHFYNVAILGEKNVQTAEKFIKKGANITIEGSLENNSYEKDGKTITTLAIKSFSFFINKFAKDSQEPGINQEPTDEDLNQEIDWDKIEF